MAKRYTDTGKWNKPFLRGLKAPYKLLFLYILDECDHAGIWQVDFQVAQLKIGVKLKESEAAKSFGEKIVVFERGEKWFIPSFLEFQYKGDLNETNKVHHSILQILKKHNLINDENKVLESPMQGAKDKDMDKDMDMDKEKDKDRERKKSTNHLFKDSPFFDFNSFEAEMSKDEKYSGFDFNYYHESAKNWSAQGNVKKDWISTVKNWMLRDLRENKPKLKKNVTLNSSVIKQMASLWTK